MPSSVSAFPPAGAVSCSEDSGVSGIGDIQYKSYLTKAEALVLADNGILVPLGMRLPIGWNVSLGGLAVPPLPVDSAGLRALIRERRSRLSPNLLADPAYDEQGSRWPSILAHERWAAVNHYEGSSPPISWNRRERRRWWRGKSLDVVLAQHGYHRSRLRVPARKRPLERTIKLPCSSSLVVSSCRVSPLTVCKEEPGVSPCHDSSPLSRAVSLQEDHLSRAPSPSHLLAPVVPKEERASDVLQASSLPFAETCPKSDWDIETFFDGGFSSGSVCEVGSLFGKDGVVADASDQFMDGCGRVGGFDDDGCISWSVYEQFDDTRSLV